MRRSFVLDAFRPSIAGSVLAWTIVGISFAGCSPTAPVSKAQIAAAEVALTEAERVAALYVHLTACPAPAPCADPTTVTRIRTDARVLDGLYATLTQAATANQPEALTALTVATAAFVASTPKTSQ